MDFRFCMKPLRGESPFSAAHMNWCPDPLSGNGAPLSGNSEQGWLLGLNIQPSDNEYFVFGILGLL